MCLSCICLLAMHTLICHFFSSSWCRGLAATSACVSSWTFLFTHLNVVLVELSLSTRHAETRIIESRKGYNLTVRVVNSELNISLSVSFSTEATPANRTHIPTPEVARLWSHLEAMADQLMPLTACEIDLLIGYNCFRAMMPREVISPEKEGPYFQRTDLGWSIIGIVNHDSEADISCSGLCHRVYSREVSLPDKERDLSSVSFSFKAGTQIMYPTDITKMLELDFSEHSYTKDVMMSLEDQRFMTLMRNGIHFEDRHYVMPLPLNKAPLTLPDNKDLAFHRLNHLRKRLVRDDIYRTHYKAFIENLLRNGHAARVPDEELHINTGHRWYIPHHGIYHLKKPGKLRVVFDCSSEYQECRLNKHLLQGPDITNTLVGVLCRFRMERIPFTCDVEQMFHQFVVEKEHRGFLRSIWWSDKDLLEPLLFRMLVHLFGATSSPGCVIFGLKQVASDNEVEFGSRVADFLRNDFYVDGGLKSVPSVEYAVRMLKTSQDMCRKGGLRLHKFASNSKEVLSNIPKEDQASGLTKVDILSDTLPLERTLGVLRSIESETFRFRITLNDKPLTRKDILFPVSSVYSTRVHLSSHFVGKQIL